MSTKNAGITLIEAVVAIVILSFTLSASSALMITTSRQSAKNKERTMATYLTQECMELSRNVRDTAWRKFERWDCAFFDDTDTKDTERTLIINPTPNDESSSTLFCNSSGGDFHVQIEEVSLSSDKEKTKIILGLDNTYRITDEAKTPFYRYLKAKKIEDKDKIQLTCYVHWGQDKNSDGMGDEQISMSQILTNWKRS